MHFSYFLRDKKSRLTTVQVSIQYNNFRVKRSTGINVCPKYWNDKQKRVRSYDEEYLSKNLYLDTLNSRFNHKLRESKLRQVIIDKEHLLKLWEEILANSSSREAFIDIFRHYIDISTSHNDKASATINKLKSTFVRVREYIKATYHKMLYPDDIDYSFYVGLMNYLISKYNVQNSSFFKYCDIIGTVLSWSLEEGHHESLAYKKGYAKIKKTYKASESKREPLTKNELAKIETLDLSNDPIKDNHRDIFLYKVYLCLRYEDLKYLDNANIKELQTDDGRKVKMFQYFSNKDMKTKQIGIGPKCEALLKKRSLADIKLISSQKFNEQLRSICKLAGIDTPVIKHIFYGKDVKTVTLPKWKTISSHISRHTHATIATMSGLNESEVRILTEHNSKSLERYINPQELEVKRKGAELF